MKVYLNSEGVIVQVVPSIIKRGSTVTDFEVEAPFSAAVITVRFILRSGTTDPLPLPRVSSVSSPGLNVWSAKLPYAVTEYAGTVGYEIEVQDGDGYVNTATLGTLTITPRAVPTLPPTPDEDAWTQMIGYLNKIYDAVANGADTSELETAISELRNWVTDFEERRSITDSDTSTVYEMIASTLHDRLKELIENGQTVANGSAMGLMYVSEIPYLRLWASMLINEGMISGGSVQSDEILELTGGKHIRFTTDEEMAPILAMLQAYTNGEIKGGSSVWIGAGEPPDDSYDLWIDTDETVGGFVISVNGQTGEITLTAEDVEADPAGTAATVQTNLDTHASNTSNPHGVTKTQVGLGNVDNVKQYSASNPPPYPVTSVNGQTGAAVLDADGVGARPTTWTPTASEVGADPAGTASSAVSTHNTATDAHSDIRLLIDAITVPTKLSELSGDSTHRTVTDAEKTAWNGKSDFSGRYGDLEDKPSIPDKANCVYYIVGTGTAAGTWIGEHSDIAEYYEGLMIAYKIGIAGLSAGTTLNINNLGAIPVVRNVSTAISTAYAVQSVINLTYTVDTSGTAYWKISDYDSNTRNTVGDYNLTDTKLYLIGSKTVDASSTSSYAQSYANDSCYIGADNHLYSGGEKVVTGDVVTSLNGATGAVELTSETWEFELEEDGTTVTKKVVLLDD